SALDGTAVHTFADIRPLVQELGAGGGGMVEVERDGQRLALPVVPTLVSPDHGGAPFWALGIEPDTSGAAAYDATLRHGPLAALPAATRETWRLTRDTVGMVWRMLAGRASVENISGPITIARYANASASRGTAWFLNFLALLSLSLAIINLLPIPILDGGH